MAKCEYCGTEFESRHANARFDKPACKAAWNRANPGGSGSTGGTGKPPETPTLSAAQARTLILSEPPTSGNAKPVSENTGKYSKGAAFGLPSNLGAHSGHIIHPHDHRVTMEDGRLKPCSGRWFCETCWADPWAAAWWFSARKCYEGQPQGKVKK